MKYIKTNSFLHVKSTKYTFVSFACKLEKTFPLKLKLEYLKRKLSKDKGRTFFMWGGRGACTNVFSHEVEETTRRKVETSRKEVEENYLNTK